MSRLNHRVEISSARPSAPINPVAGFILRGDALTVSAKVTIGWLLLPVTHLLGDPAENINYTTGWGGEPQTIFNPLLYFGLEMILLPAVIFWPAHLVLRRFFRR